VSLQIAQQWTVSAIMQNRTLLICEPVKRIWLHMSRYIAGSNVPLSGASYRQDVGDTRYSRSELVVRRLTEMGAEMHVQDPYVEHWYELENQVVYPAPGHP